MDFIHCLDNSLIGNLLFQILLEMHVLFYETVGRNGCICSVKFEFCFSIFYKDYSTTLSKHNQNKVALTRCMVKDADLVLNIYFFDIKTLVLH